MGTTAYPAGLDDFAAATVTPTTTKTGTEDSKGRTHSERHDDVEAALEAVQAELGVNPAGDAATVAARLAAVESRVTALEA